MVSKRFWLETMLKKLSRVGFIPHCLPLERAIREDLSYNKTKS
ncbi:hypothetical protein HNQ88_004512 [Aureibacter tunicatorum]|uniref:Uncharacterized protein n=1 Tax=Aureibacter tunicatorum TaxID=866807 RepID=A0AAE3XSX9_9BACT|nr:hypothetical protein [Aureibacter tunicatorum]BDD06730.1 hypothetical protein AUTU_42130 [Aureibacter tunicatorum]